MSESVSELSDIKARLHEAFSYLRIEEISDRKTELEDLAAQPHFWDDTENARKLSQELAELSEDIGIFESLKVKIEDAETLIDLAEEESDESIFTEASLLLKNIEIEFNDLELRSLFTGEHDERDAVCHLQSGEGGTEAQDWAEMLLRMYQRWAERRGLSFEITAVSEGTEAGISSAEFIVTGRRAYGMLQSEHGVHRLVRISPFNKQSNRHTSFASMHVVPFFDELPDQIEIDETEMRIDTYRSSGAGGQHVNVTDSAVRVTHLPTGVVVSCQNERSQHQNKEKCLQMLASRLHDLQQKQRNEEIASIRGENKNVGFGSQIRSYVMQPYQMVKDLRSNFEVGSVENVLDGEIDSFIESYLRWVRSEAQDT